MNMQAMLKQAQKIQAEMAKSKEEIDSTEFVATSSLVTVTMMGSKQLKSVKIDAEALEKDEIEMLEDMILIAVNNAIDQIDGETERRMGKYTQGMPGLF